MAPKCKHARKSIVKKQVASQKYVTKKCSTKGDDVPNDITPDGQVHDDYLVVFPKSNPDDLDVVTRSQSHILHAQAHENSLTTKILAWWKDFIDAPPSVRDATPILDHILLGSNDNASSRTKLIATGITHICNCAIQASNHFEGEYVYLNINIFDAQDVEIMPHFQVVAKFLERVEQLRGRALVHCISGISRSATLVIAYLMIEKSMRLVDAYNLVRRKRRCVQPNQSFRLQLAKFELMLFGTSSVASSKNPDWNFFAWNEYKSTRSQRSAR